MFTASIVDIKKALKKKEPIDPRDKLPTYLRN